MKILHNFGIFSLARGGGTVDVIYKLAKKQAEIGHDVTIYTSDSDLDQNYIDSCTGVKVFPFHNIASSKIHSYPVPLIPPVTPDLFKYARKMDFDIIHFHAHRSLQNLLLQYYACDKDIPYVIDSHGSVRKDQKYGLKTAYDKLFGCYYKTCSQYIAENRYGKSEYQEYGIPENKISIVSPALTIEDFSVLPEKGLFRHKHNITADKLIIYLGRLHRIKGIDYLISGFNMLFAYRSDTQLAIVGGDDGDLERLREMVDHLGLENQVIFTGFADYKTRLEAFVDADIMCQTSVYEQGAWATFESVLCGTPIISSSHTGAGMDVKDIDAGYLVDIYNPRDVARMMHYILSNYDAAKEKTMKAAEYIRKNLSLNTIVHKYMEVYGKCLK